ncbi:hypothetical protein GUITHDRAFT_165826 [Guillardia theta CCMP2712]|uniref:Uncharacterized protein n=2 Tax=Guillardia theta TaxID=55529 RepID=L1IIN1_GUITC|nr:hypothetical protein GUITHDRAFT_165826 [Guillardia theta CCMP2712]EKX36091.1 hypothetical protein GUITHDRAFT_165826 [Guillardia theta CCMP2712]|eukprot:XP_005823071.1 hypothetical protein GUITHDRAFT_165826 [Guillardia theta CCMP2712]
MGACGLRKLPLRILCILFLLADLSGELYLSVHLLDEKPRPSLVRQQLLLQGLRLTVGLAASLHLNLLEKRIKEASSPQSYSWCTCSVDICEGQLGGKVLWMLQPDGAMHMNNGELFKMDEDKLPGKESNVLFPGFLMSNRSVDELIRAKHGEIKQLKFQIKKMKEPKKIEKKKRKDNAKMKDMSESDIDEQQEIEVVQLVYKYDGKTDIGDEVLEFARRPFEVETLQQEIQGLTMAKCLPRVYKQEMSKFADKALKYAEAGDKTNALKIADVLTKSTASLYPDEPGEHIPSLIESFLQQQQQQLSASYGPLFSDALRRLQRLERSSEKDVMSDHNSFFKRSKIGKSQSKANKSKKKKSYRWRVKGNRNSRRTRPREGKGGGGGSEGAGKGKRRVDMSEALRSRASSASHRVADGGSEDGAGVWNGEEPQEGEKKIQDGFDVKRFRNGKYSGEFKDGKMHGLGRFIFNNGDVYDGYWECNVMQGSFSRELDERGKYKYADGGRRHGDGVYYSRTGDSYLVKYQNDEEENPIQIPDDTTQEPKTMASATQDAIAHLPHQQADKQTSQRERSRSSTNVSFAPTLSRAQENSSLSGQEKEPIQPTHKYQLQQQQVQDHQQEEAPQIQQIQNLQQNLQQNLPQEQMQEQEDEEPKPHLREEYGHDEEAGHKAKLLICDFDYLPSTPPSTAFFCIFSIPQLADMYADADRQASIEDKLVRGDVTSGSTGGSDRHAELSHVMGCNFEELRILEMADVQYDEYLRNPGNPFPADVELSPKDSVVHLEISIVRLFCSNQQIKSMQESHLRKLIHFLDNKRSFSLDTSTRYLRHLKFVAVEQQVVQAKEEGEAKEIRSLQLQQQAHMKLLWSQASLRTHGRPSVKHPSSRLAQEAVQPQNAEEMKWVVAKRAGLSFYLKTLLVSKYDRCILLENLRADEREVEVQVPKSAILSQRVICLRSEQAGLQRKSIPFTSLKELKEDEEKLTKLTIRLAGWKKDKEIYFENTSSKKEFVDAVMTSWKPERNDLDSMILTDSDPNGSFITAVSFHPPTQTSMQHIMAHVQKTGKPPWEFDGKGHPKPFDKKMFVGAVPIKMRSAETRSNSAIPENARSPSLGNYQLTYMKNEPKLLKSFYGVTEQDLVEDDDVTVHDGTMSIARSATIASSRKHDASRTILPHSPTLASRELEQGGDASLNKSYSFAPWEHIVAYRMMKKIEADRQLKTDEVNKAVEGKFAERLLLQSVNKKLADEREKKEKRSRFYHQKVIKHGVIPTKAVLAEIAQEMKYYDEKERYDRLMVIQGYESDVQIAFPVGMPLSFDEVKDFVAMNKTAKIKNYFSLAGAQEEEHHVPVKQATARTASMQDKQHVLELLEDGNKVLLMFNAEREFFTGRLVKFWYLDMIGKRVGTGGKFDQAHRWKFIYNEEVIYMQQKGPGMTIQFHGLSSRLSFHVEQTLSSMYFMQDGKHVASASHEGPKWVISRVEELEVSAVFFHAAAVVALDFASSKKKMIPFL